MAASPVHLMITGMLLVGCGENMEDQPSDQYEPAALFRNGRVLQEPVPGTVARDDQARDAERASKPALTAALLARGRERHDILCAPCHSRTGDGNGIIVQRGMPRSPSYHIDRLRQADDHHFYDVITRGYGAMYAHADRVAARDRWAIVAFIRALQLSQDAKLDDVPDAERRKLLAERAR